MMLSSNNKQFQASNLKCTFIIHKQRRGPKMKFSDITTENAVSVAVSNPEQAVEIAKTFPDKAIKIAKALPGKAAEIAKTFPDKAVKIAINSNLQHIIIEIVEAVPEKAAEIASIVVEDMPFLPTEIARAVPDKAAEIIELLPGHARYITENVPDLKKKFKLE